MRLLLTLLVISSAVLLLCVRAPIPTTRAQQGPVETVCPLSDQQTDNAIAAFAELAPIFRELRCLNCHGGVNPFTKPGTHGGGDFKKDDPDDPPPDCDSCHDQLPGWELAPDPLSFVGKSDEELCRQMKSTFHHAEGHDSFMEHQKNDNGGTKFIETGFLGQRGQSDLAPEKPKGWDQAKMVRLSQAWVDAMGGRFHGDESCGCAKHEYALRLNYAHTIDLSGFGILAGQYNTKTQGVQGLDVPLTVNEQGVLTGDGTMTLGGQGYVVAGPNTCLGQSQQTFQVHVTANIEEGAEMAQGEFDKMHVKFDCQQIQTDASGACPHGAGSSHSTSVCDASNVRTDFDSANIGASFIQEFPGTSYSHSSMTSTIVKVR